MSCPLHTASQSWCNECAAAVAMSSSQMTIAPWPNPEASVAELRAEAQDVLRGPVVPLEARLWHSSDMPPESVMQSIAAKGWSVAGPVVRATNTTGHDAQAARIAGLEANVNEKLATIAALESQLASESVTIAAARLAAAHATLRKVIDIVERTGGYMSPADQQTMRDARAEIP